MRVSLKDYLFGYKYKPGMLAWILHRLTGLGIVIFLLIHLFTAFSGLYGESSFAAHIADFKTPLFRIGEILVIAAVAYHGLNGLRLMVIEFFGGTTFHKALWGLVLILSIAITGVFGYYMFIKFPV